MKITVLVTLFTALTCFLFMVKAPELMLSPGKLSVGHQQGSKSCMDCHTAFKGTPDSKCEVCHFPQQIGVINAKNEELPDANPSMAKFHIQVSAANCADCHVMHYQSTGAPAQPVFDHENNPQCIRCHGNPEDKLHANTSESCNACHNTDAWKPALFSHGEFLNPNDCSSCHNRPSDGLHKAAGNICGKCHSTDRWKPAKFAHDEYFRFDKHHKDNCGECHTGGNYHTYTCYGCHEHSEKNVRKEHREHGIYDYRNCTLCHGSGDEHEAERNWKRLKKNVPGQKIKRNTKQRHKKKKRGRRHKENYYGAEHEDDDD